MRPQDDKHLVWGTESRRDFLFALPGQEDNHENPALNTHRTLTSQKAKQTNSKVFLLLVAAVGMASAARPQTLTTLYAFSNPVNGTNQDGANPMSGLTVLGDVLCGTAVNDGRYGAGTVFYLSPNGSGFNTIRSLTNSPDAANPQDGVVVSGNRFYGAAFAGGTNGVGAVFAGQTNGTSSLVCSFGALNQETATNRNGASPGAPVILSGGTLYGTAAAGGFYANGVVFSVTTNGSAASVLHNFTALDPGTGTNTDGATPWSGLILSGDTLFGTTSAGGAGGNGTVFSVNTNGSNFSTLYSFTAMDPVTGTNTDGAIPVGGLALSRGTLYGTTSVGGSGNCGTLFSVGTNGSGFTVLHHFAQLDTVTRTNTNGAKPQAALMLSGNNLYGTTPAGGSGANGTVFSIKTDGSQSTTLYSFTAIAPGASTNTDGAYPVGDLLLLGNSLYGTTFAGGTGSAGTIFRLLFPAVITDVVRNVDGSITLSFLGSPASTNILRAVTNLTPTVVWQNASTNVADFGGSWQFTETNPTQSSLKFYRSYETWKPN